METFDLENGEWFDKGTYKFQNGSYHLVKNYSAYFDKWFDKKTYNFQDSSYDLAHFCPEYFDKWFDKELYNFENSSYHLASYCSDHFDKWWDDSYLLEDIRSVRDKSSKTALKMLRQIKSSNKHDLKILNELAKNPIPLSNQIVKMIQSKQISG